MMNDFTVADLIALLQTKNPKALVVRFGYFGEVLPYRAYDFSEISDWDTKNRKYLQITPPDIGEEPE